MFQRDAAPELGESAHPRPGAGAWISASAVGFVFPTRRKEAESNGQGSQSGCRAALPSAGRTELRVGEVHGL